MSGLNQRKSGPIKREVRPEDSTSVEPEKMTIIQMIAGSQYRRNGPSRRIALRCPDSASKATQFGGHVASLRAPASRRQLWAAVKRCRRDASAPSRLCEKIHKFNLPGLL